MPRDGAAHYKRPKVSREAEQLSDLPQRHGEDLDRSVRDTEDSLQRRHPFISRSFDDLYGEPMEAVPYEESLDDGPADPDTAAGRD